MPGSSPDYYKILGVSPTASTEDLRNAFVALQKKYHPDVYKGADAHERTKEINEAWEWLRTPERRKMYDAYRREQSGETFSKSEAEAFAEELARKKTKELEDELRRQKQAAKERAEEAAKERIRRESQEKARTESTGYTASSSTTSYPKTEEERAREEERRAAERMRAYSNSAAPTPSYTPSAQTRPPSFFSQFKKVITVSITLIVISSCIGAIILITVSLAQDPLKGEKITGFTVDQTSVPTGSAVTFTITLNQPLPNGVFLNIDAGIYRKDQGPGTALNTWTVCNGTCTYQDTENNPGTFSFFAYLVDNSYHQSDPTQTIDVTWT